MLKFKKVEKCKVGDIILIHDKYSINEFKIEGIRKNSDGFIISGISELEYRYFKGEIVYYTYSLKDYMQSYGVYMFFKIVRNLLLNWDCGDNVEAKLYNSKIAVKVQDLMEELH